MKNVIIISSSLRAGSNSRILADRFAAGAADASNNVKIIDLKKLKPEFCIGCLACQKTGKCVLNDGINDILQEISSADVLCFATPVYYYSVCGQLKTFLDRLNPLFGKDNKFKDVYLLATAADEENSAVDTTIACIQGWIDCFEGVSLSGVIYGVGADEAGAVLSTPAPDKAYAAGKSV